MSCNRLYDYWENFSTSHDDNANLFFGTEDLTVGGKFLFLDKKMKLSGKVKFNTEETDDGKHLTSTVEHSLCHTVSPWTKYTISQKPGNKCTFDGNFEIWRNPVHYLSLLSVLNCECDEKKKSMQSKIHMRYHHKDNALVSFGVERWDPYKNKSPDVLSLITLGGGECACGMRVYGGYHTGFKLSEHAFIFHKYLLCYKKKNFSGIVDFAFVKDSKVEKNSIGEETTVSNWDQKMCVRVDAKPCEKSTLGGEMTYDFNGKGLETKLYGIVDIDNNTMIKGKWQCSDHSLSLAFNHNFRGLLTFGVAGKFQCACPAGVEVHGVNVNVPNKCHLKTKFGIFAEINETLI